MGTVRRESLMGSWLRTRQRAAQTRQRGKMRKMEVMVAIRSAFTWGGWGEERGGGDRGEETCGEKNKRGRTQHNREEETRGGVWGERINESEREPKKV